MEYFCCSDINSTIESILLKQLKENNCKEIMNIAFEQDFSRLKERAGSLWIYSNNL